MPRLANGTAKKKTMAHPTSAPRNRGIGSAHRLLCSVLGHEVTVRPSLLILGLGPPRVNSCKCNNDQSRTTICKPCRPGGFRPFSSCPRDHMMQRITARSAVHRGLVHCQAFGPAEAHKRDQGISYRRHARCLDARFLNGVELKNWISI